MPSNATISTEPHPDRPGELLFVIDPDDPAQSSVAYEDGLDFLEDLAWFAETGLLEDD